jgi:hypothetical protein
MKTLHTAVLHPDPPYTAKLPLASFVLPSPEHIALRSTVSEPASLRVRSFGLPDVPSLVRMPGRLRLDVPDSLLAGQAEFVDLQAALPVLRRDRPTYVAVADGQVVGFVRFSPRGPDGRWVATAIAASAGVYSPEPVWESLLEHSVRSAGLRGVRRLYARVPIGHGLLETMKRSGWHAYSRETIFRAERVIEMNRPGRELRRQEPADAWSIHQLYAAAVPRQIQEIDALTSHVWHHDERRKNRRSIRQTGWLIEEEGLIRAFARYSRGPRAQMVEAVFAPGDRAQFGTLLDGIASQRSRGVPVYCALRSYMLDAGEELTRRGFVAIGEQETLIRYTTAVVRAPASDPVHFPVELRPALPSRAPTFLEGSQG